MTTDGSGDPGEAAGEREDAPDEQRATPDGRRDYRSLSLGQKVRVAAREDPTKGVFILLLLVLAFGFLVAFVAVFGGDLLRLLLG